MNIAKGHGSLPPNLVSVQPRASLVMDMRRSGVCNAQKSEDTRCGALGYFEISNEIQPGEHSTGSGLGGVPYITDEDGNSNLFNLNRDEDALWLNANWSNPDNFWNPDNTFVFVLGYSLHFSPSSGRVLFFNLTSPSSEHPPYFIQGFGDYDVMFCIQ